jgi:hypothetical protein
LLINLNLRLRKKSFLILLNFLPVKSIPCFKNQAAGAVFAVLLLLFFFEDAEGFAKEVGTMYVLRIENIAKFVTRKT